MIDRRRAGTRIDHEQERVGRCNSGLSLCLHAPGQALSRRCFEPGGVDHRKGEIAESRHTLAAVTGDTRQVVDQSEPLADEPIEQGGLADIGPSENGDREAHWKGASRLEIVAASCRGAAPRATGSASRSAISAAAADQATGCRRTGCRVVAVADQATVPRCCPTAAGAAAGAAVGATVQHGERVLAPAVAVARPWPALAWAWVSPSRAAPAGTPQACYLRTLPRSSASAAAAAAASSRRSRYRRWQSRSPAAAADCLSPAPAECLAPRPARPAETPPCVRPAASSWC